MVRIPFFGRKSDDEKPNEHAESSGYFTDALGNSYRIDKPSDIRKVQKALKSLKPLQHKSASSGISNSLWGGSVNGAGYTYPTRDISNNQYGYAQAYVSIWYIRACVDLYAQMSQDVPSQIIKNTTFDSENDEIIATSEDVKPQHIWYQIEAENRKDFGRNIIPAMVYQLMLYDMMFVEKIRNDFGYPRNVRVLNTLGMQINRNYGEYANRVPILDYLYSWQGQTTPFDVNEIAYEHGFNPFDDLLGTSLIESVIDLLNVDRNLNRFLRAFFINDARPSLVGSPDSEFVKMAGGIAGLTDEQVVALRKILSDNHKGVANSFRALVTNIPIDFQVLDPPQIQQFSDMQESLQRQVMAVFGINPALLGMTENTNYKEGLEIRTQFINDRLRPVLSQVEAVINIHLLPFLTGSKDYRFKFDYSDYQLLTEQDQYRSEIASAKYTTGIMTLNEARQYDNLEILDGGDVFSNGVSLDQLASGLSLPADAQLVDVVEDRTEDVSITPQLDNTADTSEKHTQEVLSFEDYVNKYYEPIASKDDQITELNAWRKFVKSGKHVKRNFVPSATKGDIADSIYDYILDIRDDPALKPKEQSNQILDFIDNKIGNLKAIQSTRVDYEIIVEDLIQESRDRVITKRQFKTRMMQAIRAYANLAFIDGLRDGGVIGEPDDEERSQIERFVQDQRKYVNELADVIYSDVGITDAQADEKPAMWYNKSVSPQYDAGRVSADKNGMYEWVYGIAEHCTDCQLLNGQRHRMKTWYSRGILPQSDILACNGFNCKCNLVRTSASARGRLPKI